MRITSHHYHLSWREWVRALLPPLLVLTFLGGALKAGALLRLFPAPHAASDPTTTVLLHQARAARAHHTASILLLGDSTCMVDVDAAALSRQLPGHRGVIDLGLLIWLDFCAYAEALADFTTANPGQVRTVVLLVTPKKLSLAADRNEEEFWEQIRAQARSGAIRTPGQPHSPDWLGIHTFRENLLSHVLAAPLRGHGEGTAYFGFASEVDAYMTAHNGSLLDFGTVPRVRRAQPASETLAAGLEAESRCFREKIPAGAQVFIGLTPIAESHCSPTERNRRSALLFQWNQWIKADRLLTNLPPTLPDVFFASEGHLNEAGQKRYTRLLALELAPLLEDKP